MKRENITRGMIVTAMCDVTSGVIGPLVKAGTPGIVSAVKILDDVYVEFEIDENRVSQPTLCHPIYLQPA